MWYLRAYLIMALVAVWWAMTVRKVSQGHALSAAIYDGLLVGSQGVLTMTYIEHGIIAVLPIILGSMTGTFLTCKFDVWRSRRQR
jgi:hypothetical protein